MCVKPVTVPVMGTARLETVEVPCRHCWACRKNRVDDLIGRCLCQAAVSDWSASLCCTYGRGHGPERTELICKEDVQRLFKRLRRAGHKFRYLVAGEYGSKKGRSHFHIILMGQGVPPVMPDVRAEKQHWDFWSEDGKPIGFVYRDDVDRATIRYVAKYLLDDPKKEKAAWLSYSKKPLMGFEFIVADAVLHAAQKVVPRDFRYVPPGGDERVRYQYYGKARSVFLAALTEAWPEWLEKPKTELMENAVLRWTKERQNERWAEIVVEDQWKEIEKTFGGRKMAREEVGLLESRFHAIEAFEAKDGKLWLDVARIISDALCEDRLRQRAWPVAANGGSLVPGVDRHSQRCSP